MSTRKYWLSTLVFTVTLPVICGAAQKKSESEPPDFQRALGCVRTLNTAAVTYAATYGKGYSKTLAAMGMASGGTSPTPEAAELIDENLSSGKMAGYVFHYQPRAQHKNGHISAYSITARPLKPQKGLVSYFSDQTGVIRWTKENRTPTAKDPTIDSRTHPLQK